MLRDRSIICFGGEDWWYHHPHSKNHLMRRFARAGNKVIFVNSISMGLPSLANKDLLPKIGRKLKSYAKLVRTTSEGITVVSPAALPFHGSTTTRKINETVIAAQINVIARVKRMSSPILWIAIPTAAQLIGKFRESFVIYHVSDKYEANSEDHAINPDTIRRLHELAIDRADIVLYSGRKLLDEAVHGRDKSFLLEQAVDFEHWARCSSSPPYKGGVAGSNSPPARGGVAAASADGVVGAPDGVVLSPAPEIEAIPRPRLGYFGAIEPWLIDRDLIKRASRERPDWHWIFIGNLARGTDLAHLPNVHFLPPVAYNDLPHYAAGFDVCVLPWATEHYFTSYGSAIKVREYLATGKPVVISPLPEYEPMSDVLRIARSRDDFIKLVEDALAETGTEKAAARQAAVGSGTWDARAEWVSELIDRLER